MNDRSRNIDINCDLGESYGYFRVGQDEILFPYLSSCNIACGFHGGDPLHMRRTVQLAIRHGVRIGAHPGYADLAGFGRKYQKLSPEELTALIIYQIGALQAMCTSLGTQLHYVKPHGALYNHIAWHQEDALVVIAAIQSIDSSLALMGLAGSPLVGWAQEAGIAFIAEAFIDRVYEGDGRLRSRQLAGAVITDPEQAVRQVRQLVQGNYVIASTGEKIHVQADTFCIHGDNPAAAEIVQAIRGADLMRSELR
ncbi:MAG: LamB/YcsF family protein [Bacteroidetes bacterium]|nr:MAG: LamB/YcsF family protein [Bacteroidota bacterium]